MPIRQEHLLLPANGAFIAFTLAAAFIVNVMPWGRMAWVPDTLALVLVFWNVHQPRKVGIGIAFMFGLLMDVHDGSLLGEHALAYSILSYGALALHRRVPWFGPFGQMLHVLPLFLGARLNPVTQITWGLGYIKGRYGSPCAAWSAWQGRSPHWY